jgi:hypothetical protein
MPVQTQMQVRRGTASSWTSTNPTLAAGELGFETDTNKFKIGTGSSSWTGLAYAAGDIEGVTAGVGISGGGTSGTVTVTNSMATTIDAKGDLIAGTGADAFDRIAVGTNDTVLTADSTTATGIKWAAAGGMTLLSTTTLSGTSTTISSINQTYKDLIIVISGINVSGSPQISVRLNNATGQNSIAAEKPGPGAALLQHRENYIFLNPTTMNSSTSNAWRIHIANYANTNYRKAFSLSGGYFDNTDFGAINSGGMNNSNSAITSFVVFAPTGTFSAGQVLVYGVS